MDANESVNSSSPPPADEQGGLIPSPDNVHNMLARGDEATKKKNHLEAVYCYRDALNAMILQHGEQSKECVPLYYFHGVALFTLGNKKATESEFPSATNQVDEDDAHEPTKAQDARNTLDLAKENLYKAINIARDPGVEIDIALKADILYSLGALQLEIADFEDVERNIEVAKGSYSKAFEHYEELLSILDPTEAKHRERLDSIYRQSFVYSFNDGRAKEKVQLCNMCMHRLDAWIAGLSSSNDENLIAPLNELLTEITSTRNQLLS